MDSLYRLRVIREAAIKQKLKNTDDPMATYISQLLDHHQHETMTKPSVTFSGSHYDEHVGGWVSNLWDTKK